MVITAMLCDLMMHREHSQDPTCSFHCGFLLQTAAASQSAATLPMVDMKHIEKTTLLMEAATILDSSASSSTGASEANPTKAASFCWTHKALSHKVKVEADQWVTMTCSAILKSIEAKGV